MFIDASAIVSILNEEPGFEDFVRRIEDYQSRLYVSPLARYEAVVSFARARSGKFKPTKEELQLSKKLIDKFCESVNAEEISISPQIGKLAIKVAGRYGKIVGHEAKLNFGDCFAYACANEYDIRLLYKGNDFSRTDLA
ncbi:MAG: type II toxin-antitoxin system VapC family toxin [Paracoccaceae bacterium]|nr:type II toxin-antitoxin system VapC family toxin [Paracoccaceae bacterium]MDE2673593.1 type II toxin-antitoxin system VapC family toxin [Paracoccaceae bacterium]